MHATSYPKRGEDKKIGKLLCKIPAADLAEVLLGLSVVEGRKLLEAPVVLIGRVSQNETVFPVDVLLNAGLTLVQVQGRYPYPRNIELGIDCKI